MSMKRQTYILERGKDLLGSVRKIVTHHSLEAMFILPCGEGHEIDQIKDTVCIVGEKDITICGKDEAIEPTYLFLQENLKQYGIKLKENGVHNA